MDDLFSNTPSDIYQPRREKRKEGIEKKKRKKGATLVGRARP